MLQQAKFRYLPIVFIILSVIFMQGCAISPRDYLNAGIQLFDQKQWDKADAQFTKAIENKNDFAEAYFYRAMCRLNMGDIAKAKVDFSKVVELEPYHTEALVKLAEIFMLDKNYGSALDLLQRAAKTKNSAAISNLMGVASYRQGKFDEAFKLYSTALAMEPQNADVMGNIGIYYYEIKRDSAKARESFENALRVNPKSPDLNRRMGNIFQLDGDYDAAIEKYRNALINDPANIDARMDLAFALYQIGYYEESMNTVQEILAKNPELPLALVLRGMNYLQQKDGKEKAKADFEKAAASTPVIPDAHIRLGMFFLEQEKDAKKASEEFSKAAGLAPANPSVQYYAARAYSVLGDKKQAAKYLNTALKFNPRIYFDETVIPQEYFTDVKKDEFRKVYRESVKLQNKGDIPAALAKMTEFTTGNPNSALGHYYAGNLQFLSSKPADALKSYTEAVRLNPGFLQAYLSKGNVLFELGKNKEALADYQKALKIDPICIPALTSKGNVYALGLKDYKSALKQFESALEIAPDYCDAYFFRGKCLIKLGRKKEAESALKQFIKLAGKGYPEQVKMAEEDLKNLNKTKPVKKAK